MIKTYHKSATFKIFAFVLAMVALVSIISYLPSSKADAAIAEESPVISGNYIRGVNEELTCSQFKKIYTDDLHGCGYSVYNVKKQPISVSYVGHNISTGDYIVDYKQNKYVIVVTGDINGNGTVDITDLAIIKLYFEDAINLENEYYQAADVNNDTRVAASDYLRMKYHIQTKYNIHENESFSPDDSSEADSDASNPENGWTSGWM